jgi:hypothetical protein
MCVEDKNAKKNDGETQENDETGGLGGLVDHRKLVACYKQGGGEELVLKQHKLTLELRASKDSVVILTIFWELRRDYSEPHV